MCIYFETFFWSTISEAIDYYLKRYQFCVSSGCILFDFGLHIAVDKRPNGDCGSKDHGKGLKLMGYMRR